MREKIWPGEWKTGLGEWNLYRLYKRLSSSGECQKFLVSQPETELENCTYQITASSPRGQWVNESTPTWQPALSSICAYFTVFSTSSNIRTLQVIGTDRFLWQMLTAKETDNLILIVGTYTSELPSSLYRRCSNYIWVIDNFIVY